MTIRAQWVDCYEGSMYRMLWVQWKGSVIRTSVLLLISYSPPLWPISREPHFLHFLAFLVLSLQYCLGQWKSRRWQKESSSIQGSGWNSQWVQTLPVWDIFCWMDPQAQASAWCNILLPSSPGDICGMGGESYNLLLLNLSVAWPSPTWLLALLPLSSQM